MKSKSHFSGNYIHLIFACFFCSILSVRAQDPEIGLVADNFLLRNKSQFSAGVSMRGPIGENFTLNYNLGLGYNPDGQFYLHGSAGWFTYSRIVSYTSDYKAVAWLAIIAVLIPEGVGYYPDKNRNYHIAVNPLGFDYWYRNKPEEEHVKLSGSIQVSAKLPPFKNFPMRISPYISSTMLYKSDPVLPRYGFHFGVFLFFINKQT